MIRRKQSLLTNFAYDGPVGGQDIAARTTKQIGFASSRKSLREKVLSVRAGFVEDWDMRLGELGIPDAATLKRVLVDNPAELFGFPPM